MSIAMYFSGRIKAYEHCINKILELKQHHNIIFFCSLNCAILTDYEQKFIELCEMSPEQYRHENVAVEEWVHDLDPKGQSSNKPNIYSQYYNNKKCMELIENYENIHNMRFTYIIKYRADIESESLLPIHYNMEPNTIYMPDISIFSGMNDQIGYGLRDTMKIYSNVFDNIRKFCIQDGVAYHPESLLFAQLTKNGVNIKVFRFHYNLHQERRD